jgi:hypothetical protein
MLEQIKNRGNNKKSVLSSTTLNKNVSGNEEHQVSGATTAKGKPKKEKTAKPQSLEDELKSRLNSRKKNLKLNTQRR